MTQVAEKPAKVTAATRFTYMGERIDVEPATGYPLLAEYREAARALIAAKERAFAVEEQIKELMQGFESLAIDGEVKVTWDWQLKTDFDKKQLQRDNPDLVEQYTTRVSDGKRVFSAKGVVGVD